MSQTERLRCAVIKTVRYLYKPEFANKTNMTADIILDKSGCIEGKHELVRGTQIRLMLHL